MLIEFRFANYRSFRDEQRLSLVASADKSLPANLITTEAMGKERLLRSTVIYGANAAGKSNIVDAFYFLWGFIRSADTRNPGDHIPVQPFRLDPEMRTKPSNFELTLIHEGVRYQYGIAVDQQRVHHEWLYAYPKRTPQRWFERTLNSDNDQTEWYFGPNLRSKRVGLEQLTRPNVPFLTVAAKFNHPQLLLVYQAITQEIAVVMGRYSRHNSLQEISAQLAQQNTTLREALKRLLLVADLGITDFTSETRPRFSEDELPPNVSDEIREHLLNDHQMIIHMHHRAGSLGESVLLPFEDESDGTQRIFGLGVPLWLVLTDGNSLIVDELDSSLHPSIVRWIVERFHSSKWNAKGAQLIFNTHDTTLLDPEIFRRDQVWFVEKDDSGASHLYPLLDYSPRRDEALAKGYLRGRYGAIPFIGSEWMEGSTHATA